MPEEEQMPDEHKPDKILIDRTDLEDLIDEASGGEWRLIVLGSEEKPVVMLAEKEKT